MDTSAPPVSKSPGQDINNLSIDTTLLSNLPLFTSRLSTSCLVSPIDKRPMPVHHMHVCAIMHMRGTGMRELTKLLKVLSDESRLRALNLIQERECCVCEVMQVLEISQSKASRMLSALYDAGILRLRREGRWAYYSMACDGMPDYVAETLAGVRQFLASNPEAIGDIGRLKKAVRLGCACSDQACRTEALAAEG
jgi:ArsR family transcriptional regulator, arsenate/arsenite/antimonite-responsive transcriptional repressor